MSSLRVFLENQPHLRLIRQETRLWLVPTVVLGVLGSLFAISRPSVYVATLGMMVRDEAAGELSSYGGRFSTTDDRKAAQETILQIARNRQVVVNALQDVVPDKVKSKRNFPKESLIHAWQDAIAVTAPKGAELGESELIYLQVKGKSPEAAARNTQTVANHLRDYLIVLRNQRSESVIQELTGKLTLAKKARDEATGRLEQMEREIGSDLGELRTLNQSGSGESNLRTSHSQIRADLRLARSAHTRQTQQLQFLRAAVDQPGSIVVTPNGLLESHSSLKRLKEGLVDAQLRLADLLGKMNPTHPLVKAAQVAVQETHAKLRTELAAAIQATEAELRVNQALMNSYERQLNDVNDRMNTLASMRARYENLVADTQDRTAQVKDAQRALAAVVASREVADTTSLISFVDQPEPSDRPLGPGRLTLMMAAWMGGLCVGLGLLFLITPAEQSSLSEGIRNRAAGFGRRLTDRVTTGDPHDRLRRATDNSSATQPAGSPAARPIQPTEAKLASLPELQSWSTDTSLTNPPQTS